MYNKCAGAANLCTADTEKPVVAAPGRLLLPFETKLTSVNLQGANIVFLFPIPFYE